MWWLWIKKKYNNYLLKIPFGLNNLKSLSVLNQLFHLQHSMSIYFAASWTLPPGAAAPPPPARHLPASTLVSDLRVEGPQQGLGLFLRFTSLRLRSEPQ